MLAKLQSTKNMLAAPLAYLAGKVINNKNLMQSATAYDPLFMRPFIAKLHQSGRSADTFSQFSQAAKLCALASRDVDDMLRECFPDLNGQLLQDAVCILLHQAKRDGYFVEVGVGDGKKYSNTMVLEKRLGWRGILCEPAKMFHDNIMASRGAVLDRRAISDTSGVMLRFQQNDKMGEYSGFSDSISIRLNDPFTQYDVETISFDALLEHYSAPDEIDFISIDTEGSELNVLKGLSLKKRRVWLFSIEHNFDRHRIDAYKALLEPLGYRRVLPEISAFDAWYVHRDLPHPCF
jgi:FkbM family methyltransferase